MRKAFTLIELMVSITILSIIMIFLYKSYASLNKSNHFYKKELFKIKSEQLKKRVLFLDFSLAKNKSIKIINQDIKEDIVFLQSSNSMHNRYNPYIAYIFKEQKLYRLESLKPFKEYPLNADAEFSVEYFGEAKSFRVYKSDNKEKESYLVHIDFKEDKDILLKVNILN
ncbi:prepilin-type N-terminal cleavage/methylation domain-containing protein [Sulfurimonas sp.]|uniref:prepilin-type N-terminal cleavage/methylation domain-containing protein n=1 Tax=Sulfurimonas sp. TaxID=2022749 RepID=UPI002B464063|nr:prepilin-type N-terminal cleavage/methylation domain-containing protein [Sulfurimonas sp.]